MISEMNDHLACQVILGADILAQERLVFSRLSQLSVSLLDRS